MAEIRTFTTRLLAWYGRNKRDLPWRNTSDPYLVWVSEIILQQTRVGQGLDYYKRFVERFPAIQALAEATEQEVLKQWQGLGYYSRARNMHAAARQIMQEFQGKFPDQYQQILSLKGIGSYTAAAIASIAFHDPVPVVDGNVIRFLGRYLGMTRPLDSSSGKQEIEAAALRLIPRKKPGDFNQAMMEFGALYCTPRKPDCTNCIFSGDCQAFAQDLVHMIPAKSEKNKLVTRHLNYFVLVFPYRRSRALFMKQREEKDIWKGLFDFPCIETHTAIPVRKMLNTPEWEKMFPGIQDSYVKKFFTMTHRLSHQIIHARFFYIYLENRPTLDFTIVPISRIHDYPVPRLIEIALDNFLNSNF